MNKHGLFSLSGLVLTLGLSLSAQAAQALRVAADPLPHADILGEVKRQDPSLDLQVIELSGGINANALLVAGDVDANYFQHVPYLRDLATVHDIATNPKALKILEIEAPQLPRSLDDVDLAVINGNYALEAGLEPARDALGLESAQNNPYANILVTTPALKDDPRIRQLARDLESRAIADFIRKSYKGSVIPVAGRQS